MGWLQDRKLRRQERRLDRELAAQQKNQQKAEIENQKSFVETAKEKLAESAKRADLSGEQLHMFPLDLRDAVDEGYPFMKFTVQPPNGTGKVDILLYQPPGISVSDSASYANYDMGTLKGGFELARQLKSGGLGGVTEADMFATALIAKDKVLTSGATIDKITSSSAIKAGVATNPYTRTAYESTSVRTFSFSFKLIAESQAESEEALAIERTFRKFLYPKRAGSIALVYPPLFNIEFHAMGGRNKYMPNIKPCYLTSLETTVNAASVAVHEKTGAPLEIDLALGFQEERVLVRQDLYENDNTILENDGFYTAPAGESSLVKPVD